MTINEVLYPTRPKEGEDVAENSLKAMLLFLQQVMMNHVSIRPGCPSVVDVYGCVML